MKDSDWILLHELYQTKSITKAASRLYISQPALTKRLRNIEEEFDVVIVQRSSQGVSFTPAGELLAEKSAHYLKFLEQTHREIAQIQERDTRIKLGVPYSLTRKLIGEWLPGFHTGASADWYELVNDTSDDLYRRWKKGELDAVFVCGDYEHSDSAIPVEQSQATLLSKNPIALDALPGLPRIEYRTNERSRVLIEAWWRERFHSEYPSGTSAGNYLDMAWDMTAQGLGYCICFLPDSFGNPHNLAMQPLRFEDQTPVTRTTWFLYSADTGISRLRSFAGYLKQNTGFDM